MWFMGFLNSMDSKKNVRKVATMTYERSSMLKHSLTSHCNGSWEDMDAKMKRKDPTQVLSVVHKDTIRNIAAT